MEKVDPDPGPDFDFEKEKPQQGGGINRTSVPYKPRKPILGHKQDYDHKSTTSSELPCALSDPLRFFLRFFGLARRMKMRYDSPSFLMPPAARGTCEIRGR
jgi:hypothetical protein